MKHAILVVNGLAWVMCIIGGVIALRIGNCELAMMMSLCALVDALFMWVVDWYFGFGSPITDVRVEWQ